MVPMPLVLSGQAAVKFLFEEFRPDMAPRPKVGEHGGNMREYDYCNTRTRVLGPLFCART